MTFSLIFLTHTALLLGQGQLASYGVNSQDDIRKCRNELFRSARIVQETLQDSQLVANNVADDLESRIKSACYKNQIDDPSQLGL